METRQAMYDMSKHVAQAKQLVQDYLEKNDIDNESYLQEAVNLLNLALDNVKE